MTDAPLSRRLLGLLAHPAVPIVALALVIAAGQIFGQGFWITLAARAAILGLAALSLAFVLGQGGLVGFGHAAPFGLGAARRRGRRGGSRRARCRDRRGG
jgi:branched-chain amino acid transport system permease protein